MVNVKEAIKEAYEVELIVTDTDQFPATYKVFKESQEVEVNIEDFICIYNEEEYKEFINKILSFEIEKWDGLYENRDYSGKDNISWKLIIYYGDNKKIIKRGENLFPDNFDELEELLIDITEEANAY